jgi:hypothetical protein
MSTDSAASSRSLPARPSLRHLKAQARDLFKSGGAESLTDAQFKIARLYGFASWPTLKSHVEAREDAGKLRSAITRDDVDAAKALMIANPTLHQAPVGPRGDAALTYVAHSQAAHALELAEWMMANGSDVHQNGEAPLVHSRQRIPMMELLIAHGADVNYECWGWFPIIFFPCENLEPEPLKCLLDHGANPNCARADRTQGDRGTALDYLISTYPRHPAALKACIDMLLAAGGTTRYDVPIVLDILRARGDAVAAHLVANPGLVHARFPQLDFGQSGGRLLTLRGATLLHVAAEYGLLDIATLLLDRGADVNARSSVGGDGVGGQTALFHSATPFDETLGLAMTRLLVERGADLTVRANVPGHHERPGEVVNCTALGYAVLTHHPETVAFLRASGAVE